MPTHSKYIAPGIRAHAAPAAAMSMLDVTEVKLSPRVEALRKLVAAGQYQVSPRHLAHQILRAAGIRPE
ncbi:MAG TPA: flagellar biosynthesis anti-sigma factor FlgM [Polyangia bacterium]|jgi:anti-sigma28 factor (negative regulator of flagellin synthesis)